MSREFFENFKNPEAMLRGAPFWAWNGKLEENELRRQIRTMKEMGLGGFFMHARIGLNTEYLGEEWFECVKACLDEAEKQGMKAWLYDEDRWPSGAAGGIVTANPEYCQRMLVMEECDSAESFQLPEETVKLFTGIYNNDTCISYKPVEQKPAYLSENEKIIVFYAKTSANDSWYNNRTYLDTLNADAVAEFIRVTHEKYKEVCGDNFGDLIPGIFTDEPLYSRVHTPLPEGAIHTHWTDKLPEIFEERHGYNLLDRLPEIFYDCADSAAKTRHNYFDTVAHMFATAFTKQIGDWCGENNLMLTGHLMLEDSLSGQTAHSGSCMRSYEFMQAPGIDLLTEHRRCWDTAKQVSSVAHQFGQKWRLSETYGCTGWDFNFAGQKAVGDWQAALGINIRCQHLAWYTMQGEAKRDYPASISYQSPWWQQYSKVEDYFGRINSVIAEGTEVRDLLVIQPLESLWLLLKKGWAESAEVKQYDSDIMQFRDWLLKANLDFDYGDEDIISRHAKVAMTNGKPSFVIGQAAYQTVMLPNMLTIRSSTLKLLDDFANKGGKVIFAGSAPAMVDAIPAESAEELSVQCVNVPFEEQQVVSSAEENRVISITDSNGDEIPSTLYLLNENDDFYCLFVCNTGFEPEDFNGEIYEKAVKNRTAEWTEVNIRIFRDFTGSPLELDAENGSIYTAEISGKTIKTSLDKIASRIFLFPKKEIKKTYPKRQINNMTEEVSIAPEKWDVSLTEDNVAVFDMPEFSLDGREWHAADDVMYVDNQVRDLMGLERRGGRATQPWAVKDKPEIEQKVWLRYSFKADKIPSGALFLGAEALENLTIFVNDHQLSNESNSGWWCDRSLRKVPVNPALLNIGGNELMIEVNYTPEYSGLEIVYLLGSFGVELNGREITLTSPVTSLKTGSWVNQGLPFYSGSVIYQTEIPIVHSSEKCLMQISGFEGTAVQAKINNEFCGITAWPPYELDISGKLTAGRNRIAIEVTGSRRNSHGPFHFNQEMISVGPNTYKPAREIWTGDYKLKDVGFTKNPVIKLLK
jgi:hypothetical protein